MAAPGILEEKVIIVTGAGRGIGRAIALACAAAGARVVVNDIGVSLAGDGGDTAPAEGVAQEIRRLGGEAIANVDTVSDFRSARRIIQAALDTFGQLDGVVNNAGFLRDAFFHKLTEEDWDAVLNVMLKGPFNVSRHAASVFREQGGGAYVHMTSNAGLVGNPGQANYVSAKSGLVGLSKAIALDMGRFGVRSNCIAPMGWTRMLEKIPIKDDASRKFVEQRMQVTPEKNAPLAVYLLSDRAADVSGEVFVTRMNEIILMTQPRVARTIHRAEGWSPEDIADYCMPALKSSFSGMQSVADVFPWDPI